MYHHATSNPLSRLRFFVVCVVLLLGAVKEGYGQRVYADDQQSSPSILLSSVTNQGRAIDPDTSNFSTLSVTLGVLGAITAQQNLQFKTVTAPSSTSPVIVKIGSTNSLVTLLGGFSVQRTNGGRTSPVSPNYTGNQLLNLLNLFGGSKTGALIILPNSEIYDGVRLELNTTLGGLLEAYYYYAFYIVPPEIPSIVTACENSPVDVTISNYEEAVEDQGYPYTYQLYTDKLPPSNPSIIETPIENVTFNDGILTLPATLPAGDYYLEARENDIYPSERTEIKLIRNELPTISFSMTTLSVCQEDNSADLAYTTVSNDPVSYTIDWDASAEAANFIDITDASHAFSFAGGELPISIPSGAAEGSYEGVLTVKNANGCISTTYPISVNVLPKPAAPNLNIDPHSQY